MRAGQIIRLGTLSEHTGAAHGMLAHVGSNDMHAHTIQYCYSVTA